MKKFLIFLFFAATLSGATVDFRSGKVHSVELSSQAPAVSGNIDPLRYSNLQIPENKIYAIVTVSIHPARSLSVFDYSIELGSDFPCIAIREDNGRFLTDVEKNYRDNTGKKKYSMLFILDKNQIIPSDREVTLKANFPPDSRSRQRLQFSRR